MAQTTPPSITPAPTPAPQRGDRATFSSRVDLFVQWLTTAVGQFAAVATNVYNNAVDAFNSATAAAASATNAATQANAAQAVVGINGWVSGTTYAKGVVVYSQANMQAYRRIVAGAGTTDPSSDQTNWRLLSGNDINGAFVPATVSGTSIDLRQGNYFVDTLTSSKTYTFDNCPAGGYSFTLEMTLTSGFYTFPASVKAPNDVFATTNSGKTHLFMFITVNGGARWRVTVAPNYTT